MYQKLGSHQVGLLHYFHPHSPSYPQFVHHKTRFITCHMKFTSSPYLRPSVSSPHAATSSWILSPNNPATIHIVVQHIYTMNASCSSLWSSCLPALLADRALHFFHSLYMYHMMISKKEREREREREKERLIVGDEEEEWAGRNGGWENYKKKE